MLFEQGLAIGLVPADGVLSFSGAGSIFIFYENPIEFSRKKELYDEYVNMGEF